MVQDVDDNFFDRADEHIHLSNDQIEQISSGKVSASMMYATARFNAWVTACGSSDGEQMKDARNDTLEYFVTEFRKMLEENLDDYIENFDRYLRINTEDIG